MSSLSYLFDNGILFLTWGTCLVKVVLNIKTYLQGTIPTALNDDIFFKSCLHSTNKQVVLNNHIKPFPYILGLPFNYWPTRPSDNSKINFSSCQPHVKFWCLLSQFLDLQSELRVYGFTFSITFIWYLMSNWKWKIENIMRGGNSSIARVSLIFLRGVVLCGPHYRVAHGNS